MNIFASTAEQIMPKNGESFSAAEKKKLNEDLQKNLSVSLFPGEDKVPLSKIKQEISDIVGDLDKRINKRDGSILRNRLDSPFGLG